jgi:hypothetical protein
VSKATLDVNCARGQRRQARIFANSPDGWKLVLSWLRAMGSKQAHVCMEATGRHSLGVALALHDAGHVVSVVNPAQIRDFARTKLGRNKTDKVDAALIRDYAALFNPAPWTPPSPAMRRLCELQTVRAGIIGSRTEWKNRLGSGLGDSTATGLAAMTVEHFSHQLETIDRAIGEAIVQDAMLRGRRRWQRRSWRKCRSPEFCAGVVSWSLMRASIRATTDPARQSTDQRAFPRSAMPLCVRHSTCQRCLQCALIPPLQLLSPASRRQAASRPSRSSSLPCASFWLYVLVC